MSNSSGTDSRSKRGAHYETLALTWLQQQGLTLRERNFHCKLGEIDLVCEDGDTLVFVEVRYRSQSAFASAAASVGPAKQRRLRATAQYYLQTQGLSRRACRFDVVTFDQSPAGSEDTIQWLRNAICC